MNTIVVLRVQLLLISFLCFSCGSTNQFIQKDQGKRIDEFVRSLIQERGLNMNLGMKIVSLVNGKTLYELNSEKLMIPASNIKLFTAAASLHYFNKEHLFKTAILEKGNNIILVGGGDAELSLAVIDSLSNLVSKRTSQIDTLFIDKGLFDDLHYGEGWMWDEGSERYSAPISALTLNNNCIDFEYSPNQLGFPAKINIFPDTKYVTVENKSLTVTDTINFKKLKIERDWIGQTNNYLITGEILDWSEKDTIKKNIAEPGLFTGTVFKENLEFYGTTVNELSIGDNIPYDDTVLVHYSNPLYTQLEDMMHNSKNLTSESLLKYIGITDSSKGTWENGIHKVKMYLFDEVSIDTSALRIADGSGLSRYNLLTANQIVRLLVHMHGKDNGNAFVETLPHGNESDSRLEGRLLEAQDKIYAKTGSISGVSCLSGYAFSSTQGPLAFSIMINGFVGSIKPYRDFQDEVCNWLVKN